MLRSSCWVLLRHVPEVHHNLAVLLSLVLGQALKPKNVVRPHRSLLWNSTLLALRLRLRLGLRVAHCRDLERVSEQAAWRLKSWRCFVVVKGVLFFGDLRSEQGSGEGCRCVKFGTVKSGAMSEGRSSWLRGRVWDRGTCTLGIKSNMSDVLRPDR